MKPYTQYSHLTDEEFIKVMHANEDSTLMQEASFRMEQMMRRIDELEETQDD